MSQIGVIGAGAWGTALAQMLATDGREVLLWALEPELAEEINSRHTNSIFLPTAALAPTIRATARLDDAASCEVLLLVTPAQHLAATMARMSAFPRDMVLRGYMVDFVHLFAPHYSARLIRDAARAPTQEEVDELLRAIPLPLKGGCEQEQATAVERRRTEAERA